MAATSGFSARIYGEVQGSPPFTDNSGQTSFARVLPYNSAQIQSLPSSAAEIVGLPNGYQMPSGAYVYSVIMLPATGLNVHGAKLVTDLSVSTLATNRG